MNNPSLSRSHQQGGYALVIVLLLSMVVLLGLVVVTSNFALTSRRTTTEQKAVIPAQLAAESGVAYAKAKLDAALQLIRNQSLPATYTTRSQIESLISSVCPSPTTIPSTASQTTYKVNGTVDVVGKRVCTIGDHLTANQTLLFATLANNADIISSLGLSQDLKSKQDFFSNVFSPNVPIKVGDATIKSGLQPLDFIQTGDNEYTFYFRVGGLESIGSVNSSTRVIKVADNNTIHSLTFKYGFTQVPGPAGVPAIPPNFSGYGLFVNDFKANGGNGGFYTYGNKFSGPFHSNTAMNLLSVYTNKLVSTAGSIEIDGPLTSSGCTSIGTKTGADGKSYDTCQGKADQIYFNYNLRNTTQFSDLGLLSDDKTLRAYGYKMTDGSYGYIKVKDKGAATVKPSFNEPYIPMPINSTRQRGMATQSGILLDNPLKVQLSVSSDNVYQQIDIITKDKVGVNLRFNKDKQMQILVKGVWQNAVRDDSSPAGWKANPNGAAGVFNGMIYADGNINSLSGPNRPAGATDSSTTPAAIASFAGITVTAANNVNITGDVKYQNRCLTISACVGSDGKQTTENIFGVYATSGDVRLAFDPNKTASYQNTDPALGPVSAPNNLSIDGFVMSARGTVRPYDTRNSRNVVTTAKDRGKFEVHGGTIKYREEIVGFNSNGWEENYFFDGRGNFMSPPGFPTTTEGVEGVPPSPTTDTETLDISKWNTGISKYDGNQFVKGASDFSLDNEIRQTTVSSTTAGN